MELHQGPDPDQGWPQVVVGHTHVSVADNPAQAEAEQRFVVEDFKRGLAEQGYVIHGDVHCTVERPFEAFAPTLGPILRMSASVEPR